MKKILWFSNSEIRTNDIPGTGNWVPSLLQHFQKHENYEIHVAFHDAKASSLMMDIHEGVHLHRIPINASATKIGKLLDGWTNRDPYKDAETLYYQIVEIVKPNIIQIFGIESPFVRILDRYYKNSVVHIQGLLAPYQFKYYPRFSNIELLKASPLKSWLRGHPRIKRSKETEKHLELEARIYQKIRYVLGRTDWDRRCVKALAPQAEYFYCQEIMRKKFYEVKWTPPENKQVVLYTTISDNRVKNVDMIFETANILDKYNPRFQFQWRVAGVNHDDITPKIMRARGFTSPNIRLLGRLDSKRLISEMLSANMFVYPSAIENSSNAIQEAMLCGMPILATYGGGTDSIVSNKKTGILVPEGDPYVFAGAILEMMDSYKDSIALGAAAREKALVANSPQAVVAQLNSVYQKICDK